MKLTVRKPLLAVVALLFAAQIAHAQNQPPAITLTGNNTGEYMDVGSSVLLTLNASDPDGAVQWVELVYNGFSQGNQGTGQNTTLAAPINVGVNEFFAVAYDNLNASATSAVVRVLGNQPPSVSITEPAGSVTRHSLSDPIFVRGTAFDVDGTIGEVRLLENGRVIATDLQQPFEFAYKPLNFGSFNLQLQAVDNRGSVQTSQPRTVHYVRIFDNLEFAMPVNAGTNHVLFGSNVGATHQKGEPEHAGVTGGKSVWWLWRAPTSGTVTIETLGSDFDTVLAVYTNRNSQFLNMTNMVEVASNDNDDAIEPLSRVKFFARAGTSYYIAVDGRDGMAGNIKLNIRLAVSRAPAHNYIANAVFATSLHNSNNIGATKEPGEPDHAGNPGGASMWYRINVTSTSIQWRITTAGSTFDTVLAIYTNAVVQPQFQQIPPAMENLRLVAFNDDGPVTNTSEIILSPKTVGTYWIAVDGYDGAEGTIRFASGAVGQEFAPSNDSFGKAATLVGASALGSVNTTRATREPNEPAPLNQGSQFTFQRTVWYRWIAPSTGPVYMTTEWSDYDTILAVYTGTNLLSLNLVASNDDVPTGGQTSALVFNAIAGTEYRIGIAGYQGTAGNLVFALNQNAFYLPRLVPQFQSGRMTLAVADISAPVILESSNDLVHWAYVRTITSDDPLDIAISEEIPRAFYRVRTSE